MIKVTDDWNALNEAMAPYKDDWIGFNAYTLVNTPGNVLLVDGKDNFALFERLTYGVYEGHYLFASARGREAVNTGKEMLQYLFERFPETGLILGKTPTDHRGALWLNKQLGFKQYNTLDILNKKYVAVELTKERYEKI